MGGLLSYKERSILICQLTDQSNHLKVKFNIYVIWTGSYRLLLPSDNFNELKLFQLQIAVRYYSIKVSYLYLVIRNIV